MKRIKDNLCRLGKHFLEPPICAICPENETCAEFKNILMREDYVSELIGYMKKFKKYQIVGGFMASKVKEKNILAIKDRKIKGLISESQMSNKQYEGCEFITIKAKYKPYLKLARHVLSAEDVDNILSGDVPIELGKKPGGILLYEGKDGLEQFEGEKTLDDMMKLLGNDIYAVQYYYSKKLSFEKVEVEPTPRKRRNNGKKDK